MKKSTPLEKIFQDILKEKDFQRLDPYRKKSAWSKMQDSERSLLGQLFLAEGKELLEAENQQAFESFEIASKLNPNDPDQFLIQAVDLAKHDKNAACMAEACKCLERATALNPQFLEAYYVWANVLLR